MSDLFIIEAPGKARVLEDILKGIGIDARVQATKGHLYEMPQRLTPLGIDCKFREFARKLKNPDLGVRIREEANRAERVFIATDADSEGDVIAWDVAELISDIRPDPLRVRLKGMDEDSIREAISAAAPVRKADAVAGRTRAIVDRMIGAVFSRDGMAVGRVGTALLGLVDATAPTVFRLRLVAPAKDRGRPWVAECDVKSPLDLEIARRLAETDLPALDFRAATKPLSAPPGHMGDIMVRAGDRLDMSPKEAALSLQRLYEAGRMSYPRAGSRGLSKSVMRKVARALKQAGYKFDENLVKEKQDHEVHDAPYPIGRIDVQRDPVKQGHDEGLRTMVGRDLIKSGQQHVIQIAATETLRTHLLRLSFPKAVVEHVCALHWRREEGPRYPGQETWPESGIIERRPDTVLLEAAIKAGIGRPSTWAKHIDGFMARGLVDEQLRLTAKGREWIAASPAELLDPRVSNAIETACEKGAPGIADDPSREPWEVLAERIVSSLPEAIRSPLVNAIADEPPRPRQNPIAFAATMSLEEALEQRRSYAYRPQPPQA